MQQNYTNFLLSKRAKFEPSGFEVPSDRINQKLFDFQRDIVIWALKKGKAPIFAGTGLGKSFKQLEYGKHVHEHTGGNILILAPLAVAEQTVREGTKLGINVKLCRTQDDVTKGINITNYEMLDHFDAESFTGIVLDESSILKSFEGKIRNEIITKFQDTPYRLACSATPSPNSYMEFGNHAEFIGVMTRTEMLSTFFVHDGGDTSVWRLKRHATLDFWIWMASWSVMLSKPSDIGYEDNEFKLPPLNIHEIIVDKSGFKVKLAETLNEQRIVRKDTINLRVDVVKQIVSRQT